MSVGRPPAGVADGVTEAELCCLLHQAVIHDNVDLLGSLLQADGCDVNARDEFGRTPLFTAVTNKSLLCARALLQASADVDIAAGPKCRGMTALHKAAESNQPDFVALFLNYGAEPNLTDSEGRLALDLAATNDSDQCIRLITREMELRHRETENIEITLFEACLQGDMSIVNKLAAQMDEQSVKAAINRMPKGNSSLLHRACADGNAELVQFLVAHGPERLVHPVTGLSALHAACLVGSERCVTIVLQNFPELVQSATIDGMLPLHVAASAGQEGIVSLLLSFPYPQGMHKLYRERGVGERVCRLGLEVNAKDCHGRTALHLACQAGHLGVARLLLDFMAPLAGHACDSGLLTADVPDGELRVQPVELDLLDLEGNTPLHLVVKESDGSQVELHEIASALLQYKADANRPMISASGNSSCLMEACCKRDVPMLRLLLREGATDVGDRVLAAAVALQNDDLIAALLCCKSHVDADHKVNYYEVREWLKSSGSGQQKVVWPQRAVVVSWHGLQLPCVSVQWLCEAACHHNSVSIPPNACHELPLYALSRIDVSGNGLSMLPPDVFLLASLRFLDASNNHIRWLPGCELRGQPAIQPTATWHCPLLQEVCLQSNQLADLPTDVFQLPTLRKLNVSHNLLTSLPSELWTCETLIELNASHNALAILPCLHDNDVEGVAIDGAPRFSVDVVAPFGSPCSSTPKRSLAGSVFTSSPLHSRLDEADSTLGGFEELAVRFVQSWQSRLTVHAAEPDKLADTSTTAVGQSHLTELNLSANRFTDLPDGLPCFAPRLSKLDLSHNQLQHIGSVQCYPSGLKSLNLAHNLITSTETLSDDGAPHGLGTRVCYSPFLQNKQSNNVIRSPSGGVNHSRSSSVCSVRSLCMSGVTGCVHRAHRCLAKLHTLRLDHNQLSHVTVTSVDSRSDDTKQTLQLSDSDSIGSSHSLPSEAVSLSKETVQILYPNLTILDISHNTLATLSGHVAELSQLAELKLSENKLKELPLSLGSLRKLWNLTLDGCPVQKTLKAVLGERAKKTSAVLGYLKSVEDEAMPYNCMKLMFVGVESIGKTSLLTELKKEGRPDSTEKSKNWAQRMGEEGHKDKDLKGQNISTVGVDIGKLVLQRANKSVIFSTWDFAGQREYYATHQYFLSNRSIYLILWRMTDGEKGVNEILQWLVNIQARAPNAPVIIVGTHLDLITKKKYPPSFLADLQQLIFDKYMSHEEPEKSGLPRVVGRIEVSCKPRLMTSSHVGELANLIWQVAVNEPLPGNQVAKLLEQKVPVSYLHLQDVVSQLAEERRQQGHCPMLHAEQYKMLAVQKMEELYKRSFRDATELNQATNFLHENGVLLHYSDVNLQDIYFLDPQWLCDVLANVVTIREVNSLAKCGTMKTDDLSLLFKNSLSFQTEDLKTYIIDLLNKFEVALLWDGCNLLIPSLLPTEQDLLNGRPGADVRIPAKSVVESVRPHERSDISASEVSGSVCVSLLRLYLMSYFPSGFWPRLITRLLADTCFSQLARQMYSLSGNMSSWRCWQTGVELLHAGATVLRVKQTTESCRPCDYARVNLLLCTDSQWRAIDTHHLAILEILVPNSSLTFPDGRVVQPEPVAAAGLLAKLVAHVDTLLEDWYPDLGTRFVQNSRGVYLITRLVPCVRCVHRQSERQAEQLSSTGWTVVDVNGGGGGEQARVSGRIVLGDGLRPDEGDGPHLDGGDGPRLGEGDELQLVEGDKPRLAGGWVDSIYSRGKQVVGSVYDMAAESTGLLPQWDSDTVFAFTLETCMLRASTPEHALISCPWHGPLGQADASPTPDVVFQDIDQEYLISQEHLTRGRFLGKGAFGAVYAGTMIDKSTGKTVDVAMKMMQPVDPGKHASKSLQQFYQVEETRWRKEPQQCACEAYLNVRQELGVLLTLRHPHIVPLLGLSQRPLCLLLPLAPLGALRDRLVEYRRAAASLSPVVVRTIVWQVASAIEYLHSIQIIYRDLKSENVLVWSMPLPGGALQQQPISVCLSDYGVSRAVLPSGAKGLAGTVPFIAPEIIQHNGEEPYTEKVDCFSFGMFIYELLLRKLPFEKADSTAMGANLKGHVLVGGRPAITQRELATPTHLLDLMTHCWSSDPADRPSAHQIVAMASRAELCHLLNAVRVDVEHAAVTCACAVPCWRNLGVDNASMTANSLLMLDDSWPCTELWVASKQAQLTSLQVYTYHENECVQAKRLLVHLPVISCMCVTEQWIWCADMDAVIHIFSLEDSVEVLSFPVVQNSRLHVTCMAFGRPERQMYVIIDDGRFVICHVDFPPGFAAGYSPVKTECPGNGKLIHCMAVLAKSPTCSELWCGQTHASISIWNLDSTKGNLRKVTHPVDGAVGGGKPLGDVSFVVTSQQDSSTVWSYVHPGNVVYCWDACTRKLSGSVDLLPVLRRQHKPANRDSVVIECHVTAMDLANQQLYIGMSTGLVMIVDSVTTKLLAAAHCHGNNVCAVVPLIQPDVRSGLSTQRSGQCQGVISVGRGYRNMVATEMGWKQPECGDGATTYMVCWLATDWQYSAATCGEVA